MTPEELENIGGWEVPLLLLVTIERTEERHRLIFSGADTFIHVRLISKSTGSTVWEGEGAGSVTFGMLAAAFADEVKEALYPALDVAFASLPPYRGLEAAGGQSRE